VSTHGWPIRTGMSVVVAAVSLLAACGGPGAAGPAQATQSPTNASAAVPAGSSAPEGSSSAGGSALGYDCPGLLTPSELDAAAGLQGGDVTTTRRGDQPSDGDVIGVTECAIEFPSANGWFGHIHVLVGRDALENFNAAFDFAKSQGATALSGVGAEAVVQSSDAGVNGFALGPNGVGVEVGVAWDEETTTEAAVKDAVRRIVTTVLSRT